MVRLPPARPAARRLGAVDEVDVHAGLRVAGEGLERGIDDVDTGAAAVGHGADGEEWSDKNTVAQQKARETIRVRELVLSPIGEGVGPHGSREVKRTEDAVAERKVRVSVKPERLLVAGPAACDDWRVGNCRLGIDALPCGGQPKTKHDGSSSTSTGNRYVGRKLHRVPTTARRCRRRRLGRRRCWKKDRRIARTHLHWWLRAAADFAALVIELEL